VHRGRKGWKPLQIIIIITAYSETKNLVFPYNNRVIIIVVVIIIHDRPGPSFAVEWMSLLLDTFGGSVFKLRS
jgi:hypothetical protein